VVRTQSAHGGDPTYKIFESPDLSDFLINLLTVVHSIYSNDSLFGILRDSHENKFDMSGDSNENLFDLLAGV